MKAMAHTNSRLSLDIQSLLSESLSQPNTHTVATFTPTPNCVLDASSSAVAYGVKNGLLRLYYQSSKTELLRSHTGQQLCSVRWNGSLLVTIGFSEGQNQSKLCLWRRIDNETSLLWEKEISGHLNAVCWQDHDRFWVWGPENPPALLSAHSGTMSYSHDQEVEGLVLVGQRRLVTLSDGQMTLWDIDNTLTLQKRLWGDGKDTSCKQIVGLDNEYFVSINDDQEITLWLLGQSLKEPQCVSILDLGDCNDEWLVHGGTTRSLCLLSSTQGLVMEWMIHDDKIKSYRTLAPSLACVALTSTRQHDDAAGEGTQVYNMQPDGLKLLTLNESLDDEVTMTHVTLQPLESNDTASPHEAVVSPPGLSTISTPGVTVPGLANNVFSNWLGALAAQNPPQPANEVEPPPPPPPPSFLESEGTEEEHVMMTVDMAVPPPNPKVASGSTNSSMSSVKKKKKKKTKKEDQAPITILKRGVGPLVPSDDTPRPQANIDDIPPPPEHFAAPLTLPRVNGPTEPSQAPQSLLTADDIRHIVREEVNSSIVPAIDEAVSRAIKDAMPTPSHQHEQLVAALQEPVQATVTTGLRTVLIPALESITGQVMDQVTSSVEESNTSAPLQGISSQLTQMTVLVTELTRQVEALGVSGRSKAATANPNQETNQAQLKGQVVAFLQQGNYEAAFTKAVNSQLTQLVVFCCLESRVQSVLGGSQEPRLSQHVMLCLMQQLATVLVDYGNISQENIVRLLDWLQEICLNLNPHDPLIRAHLPKVLTQLIKSIQERLARNEPELARPLSRLQQILRGMPIG